MALISPSDQERLREALTALKRPVRLLFFTQTVGCETCLQARQIVDELPPLSDRITVEEVNFVLEGDRARQHGIDRVPAIAITYQDEIADGAGEASAVALKDSRMKFVGAPAGYEFISLVQAVLLAGGAETGLSADNLARVAAVTQPTTIQVFTTPT